MRFCIGNQFGPIFLSLSFPVGGRVTAPISSRKSQGQRRRGWLWKHKQTPVMNSREPNPGGCGALLVRWSRGERQVTVASGRRSLGRRRAQTLPPREGGRTGSSRPYLAPFSHSTSVTHRRQTDTYVIAVVRQEACKRHRDSQLMTGSAMSGNVRAKRSVRAWLTLGDWFSRDVWWWSWKKSTQTRSAKARTII